MTWFRRKLSKPAPSENSEDASLSGGADDPEPSADARYEMRAGEPLQTAVQQDGERGVRATHVGAGAAGYLEPDAPSRAPSVNPQDLARYFRAALSFVDFTALAKDRSAKASEILELMQEGVVADEAERGARKDAIVTLSLRKVNACGRIVGGAGEILLAVPAVRIGDLGFAPKPGEVPVLNPRNLGPTGDGFHIGEVESVQAALAYELGLTTKGGDPAEATPWANWLEGVLRALAVSTLGGRGSEDLQALVDALGADLDRRRAEAVRLSMGKAQGQERRADAGSFRLVANVHAATVDNKSVEQVSKVYGTIVDHYDALGDDLTLFRRMADLGPTHSIMQAVGLDARVSGNIDQHEPGKAVRALYPLDATQASAVRAILDLEIGETVSINGPPGSGKTSMLRAVIASSWVNAALAQADCPIVVAAGATRQSVTNVIDAFGTAPHRDESFPLGRRWLPGLSSYGAFHPAPSQQSEDAISEYSGFICVGEAGHGRALHRYLNREDILDPAYIDRTEAHWLAMAEATLGVRPGSIEDARRSCWESLQTVAVENTRATLAAYGKGEDPELVRLLEARRHLWDRPRIEKVEAFLSTVYSRGSGLDERKRQELTQGVLDITWRAEAFYWAAHYWEAEFLLRLRTRLVSRHPLNVEEALRRLCMLTPCIVSTLHTLPRLGQLDPRALDPGDPRSTLLGAFDLLIVDEAGQAPPELAGAAFALAKRAAVVGDIRQLAPIWNIDALSEVAIVRREGLMEHLDALGLTGKSSASGSALAMARHASKYTDENDLGITLLYHYRCAPAIIGYCNELCYEDRLIPITRNDEAPRLPHMSWVEVDAEPDAAGGSKRNVAEAREIAEWLVSVWPTWNARDYPGKPIKDIVAILSAYRAQTEAIRTAMMEAFERARINDTWPTEEDLEKVTIGTVHKLQGAERPVVCFSIVEGGDQGSSSFVDREPALMNVAVSRAKRAFVAFANPRRLFPSEAASAPFQPIHHLGRYLLQHGERLYPKQLVVIEAGGKRATLQDILGKTSMVEETMGAVCTLPIGGVDIAGGFRARRALREGAAERIAAIQAASAGMASVVLATDDDRMGELIAWDIARLADLDEAKRVRLGALTQTAVDAAMKAPGTIDMAAVSAELVREFADATISDRLGWCLKAARDPGLEEWRRNDHAALASVGVIAEEGAARAPVGMGRVQAAILRLVLDRGRDVAAARGRRRVRVAFRTDGKWIVGDAKAADGGDVFPSDQADAIARALGDIRLTPVAMPRRVAFEAARPTASTFAILAAASRLDGVMPWDVMEALQGFYEGSWGKQQQWRLDPIDPIEPGTEASGHPPVTPLDRAATPEVLAPLMSNEEQSVYRIVWALHAVRTAPEWIQRHASLVARPDRAHPDLPDGLTVVFEDTETGASCDIDPDVRRALTGEGEGHRNGVETLAVAWQDLSGCDIKAQTKPALEWTMNLGDLLETCARRAIGRPSSIGAALLALAADKGLIVIEATGALRLTPAGHAAAMALEAREPVLSSPEFSARLQTVCDGVARGGAVPDALAALIADLAPELSAEARARAVARCWRHPGELAAADEAEAVVARSLVAGVADEGLPMREENRGDVAPPRDP